MKKTWGSDIVYSSFLETAVLFGKTVLPEENSFSSPPPHISHQYTPVTAIKALGSRDKGS